MKKLFLSLLLVAACTASFAQANGEDQPYQVKSFANEAISNVDVKTSGGSITVYGASPSETRVEVYIRSNNGKKASADEIKNRLEQYDLSIDLKNNKITVSAKRKDDKQGWREGLSISFRVFAPKNINTNLLTSGGSIGLKDLAGSHSFTTSGGSLSVENISGETNGSTSGGSIRVVNSKDQITLTTSGGSIHAENCTGEIKLTTSGGSLNLTNLSGNVEAHTSGGSINGSGVKGELATSTSGGSINLTGMMCSLETSTSGGNVNVSVATFGKYIRVSNSGGSISLSIPGDKGVDLDLAANRVNIPSLQNFSGKIQKEQVEGKINGGGIPVTVNAGGGHIDLVVR